MNTHRIARIATGTIVLIVVVLSCVIAHTGHSSRNTPASSQSVPPARSSLLAVVGNPAQDPENVGLIAHKVLLDPSARATLRGLSLGQQVEGRYLITHEPLWTLATHQPSPNAGEIRTSANRQTSEDVPHALVTVVSTLREVSSTLTHAWHRTQQIAMAYNIVDMFGLVCLDGNLACDLRWPVVGRARRDSLSGMNTAEVASGFTMVQGVALQWTAPRPLRSDEHGTRRDMTLARWVAPYGSIVGLGTSTWTMSLRSALGRWPDRFIKGSADWSPGQARAPPVSGPNGPAGGV